MSRTSKWLLLGDLHLSDDSADTVISVLERVAAIVEERDVSAVIQLGDVHDSKRTMATKATAQFLEALTELWPFPSYWLAGNHDQPDWGLSGLDSIRSLRGAGYALPVSQPEWFPFGYMLPHHYDREALVKALEVEVPKGCAPNLFCHQGVRGGMMNSTLRSSRGLGVDSIPENFAKIWSGHYHLPHDVDERFCYVGSAWQIRSNEADQQKRVVILSEDGTTESVPLTVGKRYFNLHWKEGTEPPRRPKDAADGDEVRVYVHAHHEFIESTEIHDLLDSVNLGDSKLVPMVIPSEATDGLEVDMDGGESLGSVVRRYLKTLFPKDEDQTKAVLSLFDEIAGGGAE